MALHLLITGAIGLATALTATSPSSLSALLMTVPAAAFVLQRVLFL
jgi:hypothetical protein